MSDAFVPVDLDKLLDDFEEQDSSTSGELVKIHFYPIIRASVRYK